MVLECNSLPFPFNWGILKILECFFIMCFSEWLNVWMHLSVGLWISCFMPYLSFIFKESLYFLSITQVSSLRGEHKAYASVIHHMISCHTASILHTGSKRLLSQYPSVGPRVKHTWVENYRFADERGMGIKSWVKGNEAVQKHRESLRPHLAVVVPAGQGHVFYTSRYRCMPVLPLNWIVQSQCFA